LQTEHAAAAFRKPRLKMWGVCQAERSESEFQIFGTTYFVDAHGN
jgi:hypothetical protein